MADADEPIGEAAPEPIGSAAPEPIGEAAPQEPAVDVRTPEFSEVQQPTGFLAAGSSLSSVYDVTVTITAELGRVEMPISEVLKLTEGAVIELDRTVSTPIDIRAQGVLLARGEVVVVDDSFAVRLKEVTQAQSPGAARDVA
ncbi:MAG: flagellar motor switch protein FliN [Planctomycetaceae bacterium]